MLVISPLNVVSNPDVTNREVIIDGTIALTGSYVLHGDTLNLTQFADLLKSSQLPTQVEVWEDPPAGTTPTFAQFVFCPGTTQANGVLAMALIGVEVDAEPYATIFATPGLPFLRVRAWFPAY